MGCGRPLPPFLLHVSLLLPAPQVTFKKTKRKVKKIRKKEKEVVVRADDLLPLGDQTQDGDFGSRWAWTQVGSEGWADLGADAHWRDLFPPDCGAGVGAECPREMRRPRRRRKKRSRCLSPHRQMTLEWKTWISVMRVRGP